MTKKTKAPGIIVLEYLDKYRSVSSYRLAKMIHAAHPLEFKTSEDARGAIRYYRGARGEKAMNEMDKSLYKPRLISVPATEEEDIEPFLLGPKDYPMIVGGDAHIPYHSQDALELFIERGLDINANTWILDGDWLDMYQVSRWEKDPRRRGVKEEFSMFSEIMAVIRKASPKSRIIYKMGNHEERYEAYVQRVAPALWGLENMRFEAAPELQLKENRVEIVRDKRMIKIDHLHVIHGHEYVFSISNPVNPARGLYLRAKKTAICAHFHQTSEHTETAIDGSTVKDWTLGCLCGLRPAYMPYNKWNHGFAELYQDDGYFRVQNRSIISGRLL